MKVSDVQNKQLVELRRSETARRLGDKQRLLTEAKNADIESQLSQSQKQIAALPWERSKKLEKSENEELAAEVKRTRSLTPDPADARLLASLRSALMDRDRKIEALQLKLRRLRKSKPMRLTSEEEKGGLITSSMSLDTISEELAEMGKDELEANYRALARDHCDLQRAFQAFKEEQRGRKREEQLERQLEAALSRLAQLQLQSSALQHSASAPNCRPVDPRVASLEQALAELQESRSQLARELADLKEANELLEFQVLELEMGGAESEAEDRRGGKSQLASEDEGVASGADLTEASSAEDSVPIQKDLPPEELRLRLTLLKHRPGLGDGERSLVMQAKRYLDLLETEHGGCKRRSMEAELRAREREAALRAQLQQLDERSADPTLRLEYEKMRTQLDSARSELDELREVENELKAELKKAHTALADHTALLHQSHDRIKELEEEVGRREEGIREVEERLIALQSEMAHLREGRSVDHEVCREEVELLRAEKLSLLNELQMTTTRLQTELAGEGGKRGRKERLAEELTTSRRRIAELETQLAVQSQVAARLRGELSRGMSPSNSDNGLGIGSGALQLLCNSLACLPGPSTPDRDALLHARAAALRKALTDLDASNGCVRPESRQLCTAVADLLDEVARVEQERAALGVQVDSARRRASQSEERALALGRQHHASVVALGKLQKRARQLEAAAAETELTSMHKPRSLSHSATFSQGMRPPSLDHLLLRATSSSSCTTTIVLPSPPLPHDEQDRSDSHSPPCDSETSSSAHSETDSGHHGWSSIEVGGDDSAISSPPHPLSTSPSLASEGGSSSSSSSHSPPLPPPPPPKPASLSQAYRPPVPPKPKSLQPPQDGARNARLSSALSHGSHFLLEWDTPAKMESIRGYAVLLNRQLYKSLDGPEVASALLDRSALFTPDGSLKELAVETRLANGTAPLAHCRLSMELLRGLESSFNASKSSLLGQLKADPLH